MVRAIRAVSLPKEIEEIVEKNISSFSEYVQNCIRRDYMDQDKIKDKIKDYEKKIEELKKLKLKIEPKTPKKDEKKFLDWVKKKDNPGELRENCRVYNEKFGKRIPIEKFRELIE